MEPEAEGRMARRSSGPDGCRRHSQQQARLHGGSGRSSAKPSPAESERDRERDAAAAAAGAAEPHSASTVSTPTSSSTSSGDKGWDRTCGLAATARLCNNSSKPAALACSLPAAPFAFQKRKARIDWRVLHAVDVDKLIREADIDTLESVVDTIAFGDIAGEDTRNFTEANFLKIFQLAQLMVEYLLHVQEVLAAHKAELIKAGSALQEEGERHRVKYRAQRGALAAVRRELKQTKKTMHTYEILLRTQGKGSTPVPAPAPAPAPAQAPAPVQITGHQVSHCPFCEKVFESAYFLELHMSRRHGKSGGNHSTEEKIIAVVTKEESRPVQVAETSALYAELQQLRITSQAEFQRAETAAQAQIASLQSALRDSNYKLLEVQSRLDSIQTQMQASSTAEVHHRLENLQTQIIASSSGFRPKDTPTERPIDKDFYTGQEKLRELELKFVTLDQQLNNLRNENARLVKELESAYQEVHGLKSGKDEHPSSPENQENQTTVTTVSVKGRARLALPQAQYEEYEAEELERGSQQARRPIRKEHGSVKLSPDALKKPKSLKNWFTEVGQEEKAQARERSDTEAGMAAVDDGERHEHEEQGSRRSNGAQQERREPHFNLQEDPRTIAQQRLTKDAVTETGEGAPWMSVPEKEQWLKEHSYAPVPFSPFAVAKYPHSSEKFKSKHEELAQVLNAQLENEMKKFGLQGSPDGLSDTKYSQAAAALEKQRAMRYEQARASERRVMESERGAILWHTDRAIHTRDVQQIEASFNPSLSNSRMSECSDSACSDDDGEGGPQCWQECSRRPMSRGMHDGASSDISDHGYRSEESDAFARRRQQASSSDRRAPFAPKPFVTKHGEESQFMQQANGYGLFTETLEEELEETESPGKEDPGPGTLSSGVPEDRDEVELGLGNWASDDEEQEARTQGSDRRNIIDKQLTERASLALSQPQTPKHAGFSRSLSSPSRLRGSPLSFHQPNGFAKSSPLRQKAKAPSPKQDKMQALASLTAAFTKDKPDDGTRSEDSRILDELGGEIDDIIRL